MVAVRNYVLIDYENVQPKTLAALEGPDFHVLVFVGAAQAKISIDVAAALQALGTGTRYIRCNGGGSNALDFHIAFYIGELAAAAPHCGFHIISRDTGFDPLVTHLRARGLRVSRVASIEDLSLVGDVHTASGDIPCAQSASVSSTHPATHPMLAKQAPAVSTSRTIPTPKPKVEPKPKAASGESAKRIERIVLLLGKQGAARPRTSKTLENAISAMFQNTLKAGERTALIQQLQQRKWVSIKDKKVTYALPG